MPRRVAQDDPVFARESEMAASVAGWMKSSGMAAKSEFVTPWGICDFVGLTFNRANFDQRIRLRQTRAIGSIAGAMLLLQIPDVDSGRSVTREGLARRFAPGLPEDLVYEQTDRLMAGNFVVAGTRGQLQRVNGWYPLHERLVAVEMKLSRVGEAMEQALGNLGFADESYVCFPVGAARRVALSATRWGRFFEAGVGVLGATRRRCEIVVAAKGRGGWADEALRLYCVEKFWRTRVRGN